MIPKEAVDWTKDTSLARGITDLYDTIAVQHKTNGIKDGKSILQFKTYEQGRQKWQGAAVDVIWFDEEPPEDVYFEGLARLAPTRPGDAVGISYLTSTPLLGITELVDRFSQSNSDRAMVIMDMKDAAHMDAAAREVILARYAKHERAAREHGDPHMGGGLIFNTPAENLMEIAHSPLPAHWWYIWGIDFGIAHPFAAVLFGWDKDADVLHVVHAFRMKDAKPLEHCAAIKPYGQIPIAWPQDGTGRESNGETVASQYTKNGLPMLADHATFEDGGLSTEAGIMQMDERMTTGRWKVANHLKDWFEEYRTYHRDKGLIVKVRDDIMSASRVGMMMRRYAKRLPTFDPRGRAANGGVRMATGLDYSIFE
jgi:phage terminase large subunit-like protein